MSTPRESLISTNLKAGYTFTDLFFVQPTEKKKTSDTCINKSDVVAAISPSETLNPPSPPEYTDQLSQLLAESADQMFVFQY